MTFFWKEDDGNMNTQIKQKDMSLILKEILVQLQF